MPPRRTLRLPSRPLGFVRVLGCAGGGGVLAASGHAAVPLPGHLRHMYIFYTVSTIPYKLRLQTCLAIQTPLLVQVYMIQLYVYRGMCPTTTLQENHIKPHRQSPRRVGGMYTVHLSSH
jgi:hypothetical protein